MVFRLTFSAVLVCIFASTITRAAVQFNFSASEVQISEGGNLSSRLSIVKTGEHQGNISIQVRVTPITPNNNDYMANDDHIYVFTNDTRALPIQTQLLTDRTGEGIEHFTISLLPPLGMSPSVEIVFPRQVTVTIIDDDTVVIGFIDSNIPVMIVEGAPPQMVNIDVKQEGLRLDASDTVRIAVRICLGNKVQIVGGSELEFTGSSIRQFTTISAIDNDFSDGTRLAQLCISVVQGSEISVPAIVYPSSIQVQVMDNDVVYFELNISNSVDKQNPQEPTSVLEGDSLDNLITVSRSGLSNFTYNVTLKMESLSDLSDDALDLVLRTEYTFESSTNEMDILNVPLQLVDDDIPERRKLYRISIENIRAFSPYNSTLVRTDALTSIEGDPITITVYDNEFNIGFVKDTALVPEGSLSPLCVSVFDIEPSDIDPTLMITLQIAAYNETSVDKDSDVSQGYLVVNTSGITLNSVNHMECFLVEFPMDDYQCSMTPRKFIVQLMWIRDHRYTVNFRRQNITVSIDDAQDCDLQNLTVGGTRIVLPIFFTVIIISTIGLL